MSTPGPEFTDEERHAIEREIFGACAERYFEVVWGHANDPDFLDAVLADMTTDDGKAGERHIRHIFRFTLMRLAEELRILYPDRPSAREDAGD
ncbi:hypothetical protein FBY40_1603 [Microbacterium sp. SLBN-154]|uniref:hypothetical protein n=1 Tax=Microbacterium sp. SLBN-154 TaxID=2768458 RepID=UPI0011546D22|nr:hypothetical protein [Microbacterium sp. SLBN-154]TQK19112.1 hypothetical protein FBY40_1603 [Microbacterium sp. SLBN-154]